MSTVRPALESSPLPAIQARPIANQNRKQQARKPAGQRMADAVDVQAAASQRQTRVAPTAAGIATPRPRIDITA